MAFEMTDKWKEQAKGQLASPKQIYLINSVLNTFPHFKEELKGEDITLPINKLIASEVIGKLKELEKGLKSK